MTVATTLAGYAHVKTKRVTHRDRILDALDGAGVRGLTAGELKAYFPSGTPEGSIGGRINELENEGLIFRAGDERIFTVTGCAQQVVRLAMFSSSPILPKVPEKKENGFIKGMKLAAKILIETDPTLRGSKVAKALGAEIRKQIARTA